MLTLSMIIKNEEQNLPRCLDSVKNVVDEIVIVDTGSTDRSKEIAEGFGAKIYDYYWQDDFSAARNIALSKSTGDWILYMDADEHLSPNSISEVKEIVSSQKKLAVICNVNSIINSNRIPLMMKYTRLFRSDPEIQFERRVHEQINDSLRAHNYEFINSNITIYHNGYHAAENIITAKAKRNLKILLSEFSVQPDSYTAYQIANSYNVLNKYDKASEYFAISLQDSNLPKEYATVAYSALAGYQLEKLNFDKSLEIVEEGLALNQDDPNLNFTLSKIYFKLERFPEAISNCKKSYYANRKIIEGVSNSKILNITVDPNLVLFHGIFLSAAVKDAASFEFFVSKFKEIENLSGQNKLSDETALLKKLFYKLPLSEHDKNILVQAADGNSIETYLFLIERYGGEGKNFLEILKTWSNKFSNSNIYLQLGQAYQQLGDLRSAESEYENSLYTKEINPAGIFFLISIYVEENKINKINELLKSSYDLYADFPSITTVLIRTETTLKENGII